MEGIGLRLVLVASHVVPLFLFMASVYLALHLVFARVIGDRPSPVLWFFGIVTGPLTRPVRALLPGPTPERGVLAVSLAIYAGLYAVVRVALNALAGPGG